MPLTRRRALAAAAATALLTTLAACGGSGGDTAAAVAGGTTAVNVGALSNGAAKEVTINVPVVDSIRAQLPPPIRDARRAERRPRPAARRVAAAGLRRHRRQDPHRLRAGPRPPGRRRPGPQAVQLNNATWENLFVGIDSGSTTSASPTSPTPSSASSKYDFATYRQDNLAFETLATSNWAFTGDYQALADRKVSVSRGTNQEKILLEWRSKLQAQGKDFAVKYYPDNNAVQLALESGKIDIYLGPNPGVAYQVAQSADSPSPKRSAGTFSGAGESLQGLIAATTKKDSGLVKPVADAINYLIQNGQYQQWLTAWNLGNEAVKTSEVNPPGLPITNT